MNTITILFWLLLPILWPIYLIMLIDIQRQNKQWQAYCDRENAKPDTIIKLYMS